MAATTKRHLPWAPLANVLALVTVDRDPCGASPHRIGIVLGVGSRQIQRWQAQGWLSVDAGDRACHLIGVHPLQVWDPDIYVDWAYDPVALAERRRQAHNARQRIYSAERRAARRAKTTNGART